MWTLHDRRRLPRGDTHVEGQVARTGGWLAMKGHRAGLQALGGLVYDTLAWIVARIRERAYAPVMGRYYEYKGNPIDIFEEPSGNRWLSVRDVRRSLPALAGDTRLEAMFPLYFQPIGEPREWRIESRALEQLLIKAQDQRTIRFLRWLQRVVILPARNKARASRRAV